MMNHFLVDSGSAAAGAASAGGCSADDSWAASDAAGSAGSSILGSAGASSPTNCSSSGMTESTYFEKACWMPWTALNIALSTTKKKAAKAKTVRITMAV